MWGIVNSSFCRTAKGCSCFWNILRHKIKYWDNRDVAGSNASFIFVSLSPYSFVEFSFQLNMLKITTKLNTLGLSSSTSLSSILIAYFSPVSRLRRCTSCVLRSVRRPSSKNEWQSRGRLWTPYTYIFIFFQYSLLEYIVWKFFRFRRQQFSYPNWLL